MLPLFRKDLKDNLPGVVVLTALAALAVLGLAASVQTSVVSPEEAGRALARLYWAFPALLGVVLASQQVSGEIETGTLRLLRTRPLSPGRLFLEKAGAGLVLVVAAGVAGLGLLQGFLSMGVLQMTRPVWDWVALAPFAGGAAYLLAFAVGTQVDRPLHCAALTVLLEAAVLPFALGPVRPGGLLFLVGVWGFLASYTVLRYGRALDVPRQRYLAGVWGALAGTVGVFVMVVSLYSLALHSPVSDHALTRFQLGPRERVLVTTRRETAWFDIFSFADYRAHVVDLARGRVHSLTRRWFRPIGWSEDGRHVLGEGPKVCLGFPHGPGTARFRADVLSGELWAMPDTFDLPQEQPPFEWTPDGRGVIFTAEGDGEGLSGVAQVDGFPGRPRWAGASPDGRTHLFAIRPAGVPEGGARQLWACERKAGTARLLSRGFELGEVLPWRDERRVLVRGRVSSNDGGGAGREVPPVARSEQASHTDGLFLVDAITGEHTLLFRGEPGERLEETLVSPRCREALVLVSRRAVPGSGRRVLSLELVELDRPGGARHAFAAKERQEVVGLHGRLAWVDAERLLWARAGGLDLVDRRGTPLRRVFPQPKDQGAP